MVGWEGGGESISKFMIYSWAEVEQDIYKYTKTVPQPHPQPAKVKNKYINNRRKQHIQ